MQTAQKNIEAIAGYFADGCKRTEQKKIGLELEHFVLNDEGVPITYEALDLILQSMVLAQDHVVVEDGHFLGYYNDDFSITLEPAAQLEISIMPQPSVADIEEILQKFYKEYGEALKNQGYHLVNFGYHPTRRAQKLPLIPKKRYEYMDAYFQHSGTRGMQMMRATASTQVSIDYEDEADFIKKYRLACILTPIFSLLTDNSPVYEGQKSSRFLTRSYVWQDVDKVRCLVPNCTFEEDFGFLAYAKELYHKPPILVKEGSLTRETGKQTIAEWYQNRSLTREEIEHLISMFFPDIRLKQYLEIRPADSLPLPLALAYAELVRGIFYNEEVLNYFSAYFSVTDKEQIEAAKENLMTDGYEGIVYGHPVTEVADILFAKVAAFASLDEKKRLCPLYELVQQRRTPAMVSALVRQEAK